MKSNYIIPVVLVGVGAVVYFSSKKTNASTTPPVTQGTSPLPTPGGSNSGSGSNIQITTVQSFPAQITVNVNSLNVRGGPSTSNPLAGSKTLSYGDSFMAQGYVHGQSVEGNDIWFVSVYGHYVWSGGTAQTPGSGVQPMTNASITPSAASNASLSDIIAKTNPFGSPLSIFGIPLL